MTAALFVVRTVFFAAGAMFVVATLSANGWYDVPLPFGWSASRWQMPALGLCVVTAPILMTYAFPALGKTGTRQEEEGP